jgi:4-amino-4-deoxy-L-arabinose transferase-like glycosyltransferase
MQDPRENLGRWTAVALLLVAAFTLCFYHYNSIDLNTPSAAQLSVLTRRMNEMGTWLAPTMNGSPQPLTPPLYLWACKLLSELSPEVPTFAVRLPAAIGSFLLVLLVAAWIYRQVARYGREDGAEPPVEGFALLGGLMFVSMPLLFWAGRPASANSLFALLWLAAGFCWAESLEARRSFYSGWPWRRWMLLGYAAAGLGLLAGGPLILLMLWIPYALAARSYRLRGLDWSHAAGLLLALLIGGWWPWMVSQTYAADPAAAGIWGDWLTLRTGRALTLHWTTGEFLLNLLLGTFPWLLPALVMAVRVWRRQDRSPTLVFWMWSLVANLAMLTLLNERAGSHPLPLAALVAMLSADAIHRWNFETPWATAWRVTLRASLVTAVPVLLFICGVINSDIGLALIILIALGWARWAIASHAQGVTYTPWVTSVRLASIAVVVFLAMEVVLLADWLPRVRHHDETLAYFARVESRLGSDLNRVYLLDDRRSPLHDYYLGDRVQVVRGLDEVRAPEALPTYLFARRDLIQLWSVPWLAPLTQRGGGCGEPPKEILFRVLPESRRDDSETAISRLNHRLPYRMALLGNTGTRNNEQEDVAKELEDECKRGAIDDIVLLGNNVHGPSVFDHLEILDSFEKPYHRLLRQGVRFHAALGHEDQSYGWLQTHYPAFNMCGRRYYQRTLGMGLVDLFVLDSERLHVDGVFDEEQFKWLEHELAISQAPWKVVGLYRALLTDTTRGRIDLELSERLVPLLTKYQVDVVASGQSEWYERLELAQTQTIFLNLGWSGAVSNVEFAHSDLLQQGHDEDPGYFFIDFTVNTMVFQAVDDHGNKIEIGQVRKGSGPLPGLTDPMEIDLDEYGDSIDIAPAAAETPSATPEPAATPMSTPAPDDEPEGDSQAPSSMDPADEPAGGDEG